MFKYRIICGIADICKQPCQYTAYYVVSDGSVNKYTQYERLNPTTYLMVGQSDDDVEFATFSSDGELLEDYPNPVSNIEKIDRDLGVAIDDLKRKYPIRKKNKKSTDIFNRW